MLLAIALCLTGLLSTSLTAAPWTVLLYADMSDDLSDMAFKNITDMMRGQPNDQVQALIQLHVYDDVALRYRVTTHGLEFVAQHRITGHALQDLKDSLVWAFGNMSPDDQTCLILGNHGWGALDPVWNAATQQWEVCGFAPMVPDDGTCPIDAGPKKSYRQLHKNHRGCMFNKQTLTYLHNSALADGLAYLRDTVLAGNKLDILLFDMCMGSMLEMATCTAPFVQYHVGVQSCALRDGFDYHALMQLFNAGLSPHQTACACVRTFDNYYAVHDPAGIYTCAALDLQHVPAVNHALNAVVAELLQHPEWLETLNDARHATPRFCMWAIYTDLVAWCQITHELLTYRFGTQSTKVLAAKLQHLYDTVDALVISRCGGVATTDQAHGFSIYLPPHVVDETYFTSLFAQHAQWPELLAFMNSSNSVTL